MRLVVETASAKCIDDWAKPNQIKDIEKAAVQDTMAAAIFPGNYLSVKRDQSEFKQRI